VGYTWQQSCDLRRVRASFRSVCLPAVVVSLVRGPSSYQAEGRERRSRAVEEPSWCVALRALAVPVSEVRWCRASAILTERPTSLVTSASRTRGRHGVAAVTRRT
jgi:hypothetical protein